MTYALEIILDGLPPSTNLRYSHWAIKAKEQAKWRLASKMAAYLRRPTEPLQRAKVTCVRRSSREADYDNLVIAFKPIIDGLVDAKILIDDTSAVIVAREYRWEKARERMGSVLIRVEEVA
jgi:hypothetical protein